MTQPRPDGRPRTWGLSLTSDERGEPIMCIIKPFVEPAAAGRKKYFRYRKVVFEDGTQGRAMETRYTWASAKRPCEGPRGGRCYQTFYRTAYWAGGRFWRMANVPTESGWENRLAPIDGPVWDTYPLQSAAEGVPVVRVSCEGGRPVGVTGDLAWHEGCGAAFGDAMAPWLGLDRKPRARRAA